jgi:hypothetical protein
MSRKYSELTPEEIEKINDIVWEDMEHWKTEYRPQETAKTVEEQFNLTYDEALVAVQDSQQMLADAEDSEREKRKTVTQGKKIKAAASDINVTMREESLLEYYLDAEDIKEAAMPIVMDEKLDQKTKIGRIDNILHDLANQYEQEKKFSIKTGKGLEYHSRSDMPKDVLEKLEIEAQEEKDEAAALAQEEKQMEAKQHVVMEGAMGRTAKVASWILSLVKGNAPKVEKKAEQIDPLKRDEMYAGEPQLPKQKALDDLPTLSDGTLSAITGTNDYNFIDKFRSAWINWVANQDAIFETWQDSFKAMMEDYGVAVDEKGKAIDPIDLRKKIFGSLETETTFEQKGEDTMFIDFKDRVQSNAKGEFLAGAVKVPHCVHTAFGDGVLMAFNGFLSDVQIGGKKKIIESEDIYGLTLMAAPPKKPTPPPAEGGSPLEPEHFQVGVDPEKSTPERPRFVMQPRENAPAALKESNTKALRALSQLREEVKELRDEIEIKEKEQGVRQEPYINLAKQLVDEFVTKFQPWTIDVQTMEGDVMGKIMRDVREVVTKEDVASSWEKSVEKILGIMEKLITKYDTVAGFVEALTAEIKSLKPKIKTEKRVGEPYYKSEPTKEERREASLHRIALFDSLINSIKGLWKKFFKIDDEMAEIHELQEELIQEGQNLPA